MALSVRAFLSSLLAHPGASTLNALVSMCLSASAVFVMMDPKDCGLGNAFVLYFGTPLLAMAGFFAGWVGGALSMERWTRKKRFAHAALPWSVMTTVCSVVMGWGMLFLLCAVIAILF